MDGLLAWHEQCACLNGGFTSTASIPQRSSERLSVRELNKRDLITFLYGKVGRWNSIWWNGELLSLGEALGRANELMPSERALCSRDEVLLPGDPTPSLSEACVAGRREGAEYDPL